MTCRVIDAQEFFSSNAFYNEELEGPTFTVPTLGAFTVPTLGALQVVSTPFDNACHIKDK